MLNVDEIFDTLANPRWRRLLVRVLEPDPEDDPIVYAEDIDVDDAVIEELLLQITRVQLPKLEVKGFINSLIESDLTRGDQ